MYIHRDTMTPCFQSHIRQASSSRGVSGFLKCALIKAALFKR